VLLVAEQIFAAKPAPAMLAPCTLTNWNEIRRSRTVLVGATGCTGLVGFSTFQTFGGLKPF